MKKVLVLMVSSVLVAAFLFTGCHVRNNVVHHLDKTKVDSFTSLELDIDVAKIDVITNSDEYAIEYNIMNQDIEYKVENDVLKIDADTIDKLGFKKTENCYVKIYIPEGCEFKNVDCTCEVGSINMRDLTVDSMSVTSSVGDVNLDDIVVNTELSVTNDVGNTDVKLANEEYSYSVSSDVGSVSINGKSYNGFEISKSHKADNGPEINLVSATGRVKLA